VRGFAAAVEVYQHRFSLIIDDLILFYEQEMEIISQQSAIAEEGRAVIVN